MFKKSPLVLALLLATTGANAVPSYKVCSNESGKARSASNIYFSDDCKYAYVGLPNYGKAMMNGYTSMNLDQCQNYDQVNDTIEVIVESAQRNIRRIVEFTNEVEEVQQKLNELEEERVGFELEAVNLGKQIDYIVKTILPPLEAEENAKLLVFAKCRKMAKTLGEDILEFCSDSYQEYDEVSTRTFEQNIKKGRLTREKSTALAEEYEISNKIERLRRNRSALEDLLISAKNRVNDLLKEVRESKQYYFRIYGATASLLFTTDVDNFINEKRRAFEADNTGFEDLIWRGISPLPNSTEIDFLVNQPGDIDAVANQNYPIMSIETPDSLFRKPSDSIQFFSAGGNKDYLAASPFPNSFSAVLKLNVAGACEIEHKTDNSELLNYVNPNVTAMFEIKGKNSYRAEIKQKRVVEFFEKNQQLGINAGAITYADVKKKIREAKNLDTLVTITFTADTGKGVEEQRIEKRMLEENLVERAMVNMLDTIAQRTVDPNIEVYRQEVKDGLAQLPQYDPERAESGVEGARFVDSGTPATPNIQWESPIGISYQKSITDYKSELNALYVEEVTEDSFTPLYQSFGFKKQ